MVLQWLKGVATNVGDVLHKYYVDTVVNKPHSRDHMGDVDAIVSFTQFISLSDILPPGYTIQPDEDPEFTMCLLEFKTKYHRDDLKQFVEFYDALCSNQWGLTHQDCAREKRGLIRTALNFADTCFIFLYDKADPVDIQAKMQRAISRYTLAHNNDMTIQGHKVYCVHCSTTQLAAWQANQQVTMYQARNIELENEVALGKRKLEDVLERTSRALKISRGRSIQIV